MVAAKSLVFLAAIAAAAPAADTNTRANLERGLPSCAAGSVPFYMPGVPPTYQGRIVCIPTNTARSLSTSSEEPAQEKRAITDCNCSPDQNCIYLPTSPYLSAVGFVPPRPPICVAKSKVSRDLGIETDEPLVARSFAEHDASSVEARQTCAEGKRPFFIPYLGPTVCGVTGKNCAGGTTVCI